MTDTIAQALQDAHIIADTGAKLIPVQSTYAHFDPIDVIENIKHPMLKAMVLGSMEWSVKTACINIARDVFYKVRASMADTDNAIDDFNEYINTIAELKANEQYNTDLGFEENTGALTQLAMLTTIGRKWYDYADTAHGAAKLAFKTKTYSELIASEKVRTLDSEAVINIEALAEFASRRGSKEISAEKLAERAKRTQEAIANKIKFSYAAQHATRQLVAPAVINIIGMAEYRATEDVEFWQLALEAQERLISSTVKAIERNVETLATWRGITTIEYASQIMPDAFAAIDDLEAVLASPKFK
jgi:hypothetical protein